MNGTINLNYSTNGKVNQFSKPCKAILALFWVFSLSPAFGQSSVAYLRTSAGTESHYDLPSRNEKSIPFQLVRGMIVMQARINHQPGQFILDTGAPLMIINDHPETATRRAASFKQQVRVGETTIRDFNWAGTDEKQLEALVLDISHLEYAFEMPLTGMIGFNAIREYELFFDYEQQFILPYHPRRNFLHKNARPLHVIPFQLFDHLPVITVQIGKRKFTFGLDTGACANMIDQSVLGQIEAELITTLPDEEVQGLDQSVSRVQAVQLEQIQVKDLAIDDLKFLSTDMPELHSEEGIVLDGLLGYSFLSRMKFSINYPKQRIYVWE